VLTYTLSSDDGHLINLSNIALTFALVIMFSLIYGAT